MEPVQRRHPDAGTPSLIARYPLGTIGVAVRRPGVWVPSPEDDSGDEVPAVVATSPAAGVWVIGASASPERCRSRLCWPYTPSGPRAAGRDVSCRSARFHGLAVETVGVVAWSVSMTCCRLVVSSMSLASGPVAVLSASVPCCSVADSDVGTLLPLSTRRCRCPAASLSSGRRHPLL